jgi:hypothetical protein
MKLIILSPSFFCVVTEDDLACPPTLVYLRCEEAHYVRGAARGRTT